MSASGPTKTSRPSSRYGENRSNGASETFSPARFGARSRSSVEHRQRHRVAARALELVDVERERSAGGRGGREVLEQRPLVEREVRRPDHRDRVDAGLGCVRRERDRVRRRLGAAVCGDLQPSRRGLEEELDHPSPLAESKSSPSPVVPRASRPSMPELGEEVDVRPEGALVDLVPVERRDCGGQRSVQHRPTLLRVRRDSAAEAPPLPAYCFFGGGLTSTPVTRSTLSSSAVSRPPPPETSSRPPSRASKVSEPAPPSSVSIPAPPVIRSLPAWP